MRPGPWRHRHVPANGARFHVVLAGPAGGTAPLVVLLHGFPQFWWAWREQLTALGDAGYRVAAIDLRGAGGSDKPPLAHDVPTLAADVAGVVRSLGEAGAVVVGHGLGGVVAWSMPVLHPEVTRGLVTLAAPHPVPLLRVRNGLSPRALALLARLQLPWFPERALIHGSLVEQILRDGSAPERQPAAATVDTYRRAMRLPSAAHCTLEHLRWLVRSTPRVPGRRYLAAMAAPVTVPGLSLRGALDPFLPARAFTRDAEHMTSPLRTHVVRGAGHFLPEEAADEVSRQLLGFLGAIVAA